MQNTSLSKFHFIDIIQDVLDSPAQTSDDGIELPSSRLKPILTTMCNKLGPLWPEIIEKGCELGFASDERPWNTPRERRLDQGPGFFLGNAEGVAHFAQALQFIAMDDHRTKMDVINSLLDVAVSMKNESEFKPLLHVPVSKVASSLLSVRTHEPTAYPHTESFRDAYEYLGADVYINRRGSFAQSSMINVDGTDILMHLYAQGVGYDQLLDDFYSKKAGTVSPVEPIEVKIPVSGSTYPNMIERPRQYTDFIPIKYHVSGDVPRPTLDDVMNVQFMLRYVSDFLKDKPTGVTFMTPDGITIDFDNQRDQQATFITRAIDNLVEKHTFAVLGLINDRQLSPLTTYNYGVKSWESLNKRNSQTHYVVLDGTVFNAENEVINPDHRMMCDLARANKGVFIFNSARNAEKFCDFLSANGVGSYLMTDVPCSYRELERTPSFDAWQLAAMRYIAGNVQKELPNAHDLTRFDRVFDTLAQLNVNIHHALQGAIVHAVVEESYRGVDWADLFPRTYKLPTVPELERAAIADSLLTNTIQVESVRSEPKKEPGLDVEPSPSAPRPGVR